MTTQPDLVCAYWTTAIGATPHGDPEYSSVDFRDRVEQSAKAGYKGLGFWHSDLAHVLESYSLSDMKKIMDDNGIDIVEMEFLEDWFVDDPDLRKASDERRTFLLEAGAALNAARMKIGDFQGKQVPMSQWIDSFASVCEDSAPYGMQVGFEMLPNSHLNSLAACLELCEGANQSNGGIYFDIWHIVKLGIPFDEVARFPAKYRAGVELNDGFIENRYEFVVETTCHRQIPGEGEFDIPGFIRVMQAAGHTGPWGIEILNKRVRDDFSLEDACKRTFEASMAQFKAV